MFFHLLELFVFICLFVLKTCCVWDDFSTHISTLKWVRMEWEWIQNWLKWVSGNDIVLMRMSMSRKNMTRHELIWLTLCVIVIPGLNLLGEGVFHPHLALVTKCISQFLEIYFPKTSFICCNLISLDYIFNMLTHLSGVIAMTNVMASIIMSMNYYFVENN